MAVLGSIYHDFPRLAKQSGFYFQLHKGRVNWTELENLNLDEIIQNRNFQLLEQNLINVINCDLEREYDLKILDQNFVKLFKLAQLGVDYLSYCEMYLDRCVVLLQERLTNFQQECECLRQENQKKKEELNRSRRKSKTESFQCQKCEKVFISEVYLKFHDKRRHSSPSTPQSSDGSQRKFLTDSCQQTENSRKLSTSTQTLFFDTPKTDEQENEESENIKMQHHLKIEKLEQQLQEFKERLKKAEISLTEKNETFKSNPPFHVPGPMCCNSMLMLLPSYLKQSDNGFYEINPAISLPVPETAQQVNSPISVGVASENFDNKSEKISTKENFSLLNTESEKVGESEGELPSEIQKPSIIENFQNYHEEKEDSKYDKENVDPNVKKNILNSLTPPLPPPRKLKRETRVPVIDEEKHIEEVFIIAKEIHSGEETGFKSNSVTNRSPFKEKQDEGTQGIIEISETGLEENLNEINKPETILTENLNGGKPVLGSQSVIRKIIKRNSPKLHKLSKNLKRSLTNLYDSVSSSEKDLKCKESRDKNFRTTVVDGLNTRLKQLGVDPEWSGIPRKTMKQKLNALKHRRRLLSKENSMYPALRQSIEEKIFQKLKKNFSSKKATFTPKSSKEESINLESPEAVQELYGQKPEFVKVKNCRMYDIDTDSESESERNFDQDKKETSSQKDVIVEEFSDDVEKTKQDQEFDFSVFQVGRGDIDRGENRQKSTPVSKEDELSTVLDNEDSSLENSDKSFMTLKSFLSSKGENNNPTDNYDNMEESGKVNSEDQSILKESFHSKTSTNPRKKVLFANYSIIDEELSDSPIDDDLWSFKSDREKGTG